MSFTGGAMKATRKETFGELLRGYRKAGGRTQEDLAERANLSFRTISDLERGVKQRPHSDTVHMLALALSLSDEERVEFEQAARLTSITPLNAAPIAPLWDNGVSKVSSALQPTHNLPSRTTSFVGRKNELE